MRRADDHEKLNRKQKLHRFKQVKWLKKKLGKKYRELLTADIFFIFYKLASLFANSAFYFFFNHQKFSHFFTFAKSEKKREL